MPNPPENEPAKPKEPSKAEKGASAKSGKDAEIEKAKEIIEKVTSRDESVRLEAIQKLRNPSLENLDQAKEILKSAPIEKVDWLGIKSAADVQFSPEAAMFADRLARAGDLANDPRYVLAETIKAAYSIRPDATADARREMNKMIVNVGEHLRELMQAQTYEGIEVVTFDEAMYGSSPLVPSEANIFKEEKPEEETVTDPELIRLLREINRKIRTDPEYLKNPENLENDIKNLQQKASERDVPEGQIREAITRLRDIESKIRTETGVEKDRQYREKREAEIEDKLVRYSDVMKKIPEGDRLTGEKLLNKEKEAFIFDRGDFSSEDIRLLKSGQRGQDEFFYKFISEIYTMGKTFDRADLPEIYKYDKFKDFIKWMYPKNRDYYLQTYEVIMKDIPKHYQTIKNLLFTPGDITDKLKNLRFLSGADLDLYGKTIFGGNYAISIYDETVRDVLSERRMEYDKAYAHLNSIGVQKVIEDYKDLAKKFKTGELTDSKDQLKYQQLSKEIDAVGYGVMLWDTDLQNYTELDLEVNAMSHELDNLLLKQQDPEKKLTDWETERVKMLDRQIDYKKRRMQYVKENGDDLHKTQHENKGLSPIDLKVKERLRMVLEDRYPGRELPDWELNFAVWAARQWHIGSAHLMSTAASMAIRPAFEFKDVIEEINTGKYIMKSPVFEDVQRAFNPDMFFDRFSMAGKVGAVFRAQLDRALLETKGYVFKNDRKYRGFEDEKKLDPVVRETKEFIRQVEAETGIPFTESIVQGFLKTGGNFDGTVWRAEIGALEQIRDKYLDMQKRGELPPKAQLDNQALGLQFALKDEKGKKEVLDKIMKRHPSVIMQILGGPMDTIYNNRGLSDINDRFKFRSALVAAQTHTWDIDGQQGEKRFLAFEDVDLPGNRTHFDAILKPYLLKEGFSEGQMDGFFSLLGDVKGEMKEKAGAWAKNGFPFTFMLSDIDWRDPEMFRMGTLAMDRRARDMGAQAQVMALEKEISSNPVILCNKDPKETLKKIKEFRDAMVAYASPEDSDKAAYEVTKAWLNFNRNRLIHNDKEGIPGALKTILPWIPGVQPFMTYCAELDTHNGLIARVARIKVGPKDNKQYLFGNAGKAVEYWMEEGPKRIAQNVSYAVRYTGTHGNAFEEKEIDEILNEMFQMGMFVEKEGLYHKLRREMKASIGFQVVRLIRKYWWIAPLAAAFMGAKEGMEEEKKRSGGGGH